MPCSPYILQFSCQPVRVLPKASMSPSKVKSIHWLVPTTIILALVIGSLLALGHDLFYASLNSNTVSTEPYFVAGRPLPRQQLDSAVGVAFAFLFRTSLSIAISTAYVQFFWKKVGTTKQSPTLAELDWASQLTNNVLRFFNFKYWRKYSILVIMAILFW